MKISAPLFFGVLGGLGVFFKKIKKEKKISVPSKSRTQMFTAAQRVAGEHPEANPCAPGGEWLSTLRCSHTVKPYSGTERDEPEVRAASDGGGLKGTALGEKCHL